ncbi:hypothetical protein ABZP36_021733 [Zizania latifolia]
MAGLVEHAQHVNQQHDHPMAPHDQLLHLPAQNQLEIVLANVHPQPFCYCLESSPNKLQPDTLRQCGRIPNIQHQKGDFGLPFLAPIQLQRNSQYANSPIFDQTGSE